MARRWTPPGFLTALLAIALVACQSPAPSQSVTSASAAPTATPAPTATSLPVVAPRPTDIPTDGTCADGHVCLGLLAAGRTYTTQAFDTPITFSVPVAGWENLGDDSVSFQLLPISAPGDAIAFFRNPRAVAADESFADVGPTVSELTAWLTSNALLTVTPAQPVTIGGLNGVTMDISIAPGASSHPARCHLQTCVSIFREFDPNAHPATKWDWGSSGPEMQRLYLLTATDGVVAIFVDSLDGTTFEALTKAADQIIGTLHFG